MNQINASFVPSPLNPFELPAPGSPNELYLHCMTCKCVFFCLIVGLFVCLTISFVIVMEICLNMLFGMRFYEFSMLLQLV